MLYVVTAVHDRYEITKKFVQQLKSQTDTSFRLILVDDGCTDGTPAMVRESLPDAVILTGNGNLWWGGAMHKAVQYLRPRLLPEDVVLFANDDTVFPADYLARGAALLQDYPHAMLAGLGISLQTGEATDGAMVFDCKTGRSTLQEGEVARGNCASTRSLFVRGDDVKRIGGFHPFLLPHYGSDYEWTMRGVRKHGMQVVCRRDLTYSLNQATTGDHSQRQTLRQLFSRRSVRHPIYRLNFCLMTSPWGKKIPSVIAQIKRI